MSGNKHLAETLHHKSKSAKSPQGDTALVPARLHWKRKRIFQWARADSEVRYLQNERAAVIANRAHWVNTSARTRWTGEELLTKNNEVKKYHKWKEISSVCSGQSATIAVFAVCVVGPGAAENHLDQRRETWVPQAGETASMQTAETYGHYCWWQYVFGKGPRPAGRHRVSIHPIQVRRIFELWIRCPSRAHRPVWSPLYTESPAFPPYTASIPADWDIDRREQERKRQFPFAEDRSKGSNRYSRCRARRRMAAPRILSFWIWSSLNWNVKSKLKLKHATSVSSHAKTRQNKTFKCKTVDLPKNEFVKFCLKQIPGNWS